MEKSATSEQKPLTLSINDKNALYVSYMSFVTNGGLFIPDKHEHKYKMGAAVSILLSLMAEKEKLLITGKIVWKTPADAGSYRVAGIGVQFSGEDNGVAKAKIENYLAGLLDSNQLTHTL